MKYSFKILIIMLILCNSPAFADHSYFKSVKKKLKKDGFKKSYIEKIYKPQNITFQFGGTSLFFKTSEYKLDYSKFLSDKFISKGKEYIKKHKKTFDFTTKKYGVPPEIITSILTIETRLGDYTGKIPVLASLSSLSAMEKNHVKKMVKKSILSRKNRYSSKKFKKRADSKSKWAYRELKKFIDYSRKFNLTPSEIKGSYAGAMGIPQFMPSNIIPYGADGNNDNKIDLQNHEDAIASVANYLKKHGWEKNHKKNKDIKTILTYNKSKPYAKTVLKLAKMIGEKR
ncbi:MAG: protein MltB [Deltaproteobacteria bacterium]|nr:MAG: protein MltB [Deltaproteobacteria bacterium]